MELIYEEKNNLSKELCKKIIEIFEIDNNKSDGITLAGVIESVKNTKDLNISTQKNKEWKEIDSILCNKLREGLSTYLRSIKNTFLIDRKNICKDSGFQVQRYICNEGHYIYHDDFTTEKHYEYRVITYLWYLNDVEEGGETEFWGSHRIKPEAGKLIFFPSFWTHPHCARMPISNNKYIVTGWITINVTNNTFFVD